MWEDSRQSWQCTGAGFRMEEACSVTKVSDQEESLLALGVTRVVLDSRYRFRLKNYRALQAMVFAIEEINANPNILPNITIGFQIYDSCRIMQRSLEGTLWILAGQNESVPNFCCREKLQLMGIIGDAGSSGSIVMARVLGLYRLPQISYVSSSPILSDRNQFPSFFRTIPSDTFQSQGLAEILLHFGWTWVGLLAEDNDYGQLGATLLKKELEKVGACIAFSENIILSRADRNALHIIQVLQSSTANVIVVFCSDAGVSPLMEEMSKYKVTRKVLIASEGWSISTTLSIERFSNILTGTIGFATRSEEIPGFIEHLNRVHPSRYAPDIFAQKLWEEAFGCLWMDQKQVMNAWDNGSKVCTGKENLELLLSGYNDETNFRGPYNVYIAVYANAWALHSLISRIVSFLNGSQEDFLDLKPWQVPVSVCSKSCMPGFRKAAKEGEPVCCFLCFSCPPGEISNQTGSTECFKCPWDQWPNARQDECILKTIEFLSYDEPLGTCLTAICIFSSLIPLGILHLFVLYRNTPIVKANNRSLSYLLLLSLSLCFLSSLAFIGYPTAEKCLLRQAAFGIIFALCVSCILSKTIMVVIAFKVTKPNSDLKRWVGPKLSYLVICVCTLIQVLLCLSWLILSPPFSENNIHILPGKIIIECNEGSQIAFWCMLGYLGLLATNSFIVAFLARKLPDSFNEAKFITFSMLAFLSVWLSFIPAYLSTKGKYMVAMEIFAILSSSSALVSCIFIPKCYIILWRPHMNTKEYLMGKTTGHIKKDM
ncbi:extracellular calcium-sensing receptor-like [Lissotriton helveticus]